MGTAPGTVDYDNICVNHVKGRISGISNDTSGVSFQVKKLSAYETSGFKLNELSTDARITETDLYCANLRIHAEPTADGGASTTPFLMSSFGVS